MTGLKTLTSAEEILALRQVVRFFFEENAEHITGSRTFHGEYKVWINGEKGYLPTACADAIERALHHGNSLAGDGQ